MAGFLSGVVVAIFSRTLVLLLGVSVVLVQVCSSFSLLFFPFVFFLSSLPLIEGGGEGGGCSSTRSNYIIGLRV